MVDYEALILARQERVELWEDGCVDGDYDADERVEEHYNPIILKMLAKHRK